MAVWNAASRSVIKCPAIILRLKFMGFAARG